MNLIPSHITPHQQKKVMRAVEERNFPNIDLKAEDFYKLAVLKRCSWKILFAICEVFPDSIQSVHISAKNRFTPLNRLCASE
jgi:hypothetical protein